ncbi:hypothetical protein [Methanocaldococcus sp.]
MQRVETLKVKDRILKIIDELNEINRELKNKAIEKAIENLKIAVYGDKIGSEGFYHNYMREKLLEMFQGSQYIESSGTKISNLGFRPDLVIINKKELIIAEIETNNKRALRKMEKIAKVLDKLKNLPIATNRNVRIIFCLLETNDKIITKAKKHNFEIFVLDNFEIKRLI